MTWVYNSRDLEYSFGNSDEKDFENFYYWKFSIENWEFAIFKWKEKIHDVSIKEDFLNFFNENKSKIKTRWYMEIDEKFELEKDFEDIKIKLILNRFSVENPDYTWEKWDFPYRYLDWNILIKLK